MRSEARKQTGGSLLDHVQAFGRSDMETVIADLITPDGILWRTGAMIPAASAPGEDLGYLSRHRIFACLPEIAGYRKPYRREPVWRSR